MGQCSSLSIPQSSQGSSYASCSSSALLISSFCKHLLYVLGTKITKNDLRLTACSQTGMVNRGHWTPFQIGAEFFEIPGQALLSSLGLPLGNHHSYYTRAIGPQDTGTGAEHVTEGQCYQLAKKELLLTANTKGIGLLPLITLAM